VGQRAILDERQTGKRGRKVQGPARESKTRVLPCPGAIESNVLCAPCGSSSSAFSVCVWQESGTEQEASTPWQGIATTLFKLSEVWGPFQEAE
jgi:hypothetical protein